MKYDCYLQPCPEKRLATILPGSPAAVLQLLRLDTAGNLQPQQAVTCVATLAESVTCCRGGASSLGGDSGMCGKAVLWWGSTEMQVEAHHADTVAEEAALRPPRQ